MRNGTGWQVSPHREVAHFIIPPRAGQWLRVACGKTWWPSDEQEAHPTTAANRKCGSCLRTKVVRALEGVLK